MNAGRTLKAIRRFHGLSVSETARRLEYSKSFISDLENENKSPSLESLNKYSSLFNIPTSSLMLLIENSTQDPHSIKKIVRQSVKTKILRILEFMSPEEDLDDHNSGQPSA